MDIIYLVGTRRGFAARQCGKALPYRRTHSQIPEAAPLADKGGIASNQWNLVTVRQSRTVRRQSRTVRRQSRRAASLLLA